MLITIEPTSDTPIYIQLRDQVVGALVRGELSEGDSLPSVRQLARDLGINLHTVNKAYKALEDEGYLHLQGRRGARITTAPTYTDDYIARLEAQLAHLWIDAQSQGISASLFTKTVQNVCADRGKTKILSSAEKSEPEKSGATKTDTKKTGTQNNDIQKSDVKKGV